MGEQYTSTNMLSVEEAQEQILALAPQLAAERVSMLAARGRVLAADIVSDIDIAPFDNSAMDGYALKAASAAHATAQAPAVLRVVGSIAAGEFYQNSIGEGEALRIMTGAPVPTGADTVVKVEDTTETSDGGVAFTQAPKLGANIRLHGEDARAGEVLLTAGTVLTAAGVGLLASTGNTELAVYRRPSVAIFSTGSELVAPTECPGPGQIRNSNCYSLAAAVTAAGGVPQVLGVVRDEVDELRSFLAKAVAAHDLVLLSGGAAEGDFDFTSRIVQELGTLHFNKVRMRPGKAQTLGYIDDTIVFGLPGNPAAAMVGFEVLIRPALRKMQGYTTLKRPLTHARITVDIAKPNSRRLFIRARVERDAASGEFTVTPEANQSSALLSALQDSNCLMVLPEGGTGIKKGQLVACLRLDLDEGAVA